jgi:hypothetical protein
MSNDNFNANPEENDKSEIKKPLLKIIDIPASDWSTSKGSSLYLSPEEIQDIVNDSMIDLGGTISALSLNIHKMQNTLSSTDSLVTSKDFEALLNKFQELSKSVSNIEGLIPNFESIKHTLDKVNKFNETNTAILTDLVSANGRLDGIQGEMNSIKYRFDELEEIKDRNTNRNLSFLAIVVAVISVIFAWFK